MAETEMKELAKWAEEKVRQEHEREKLIELLRKELPVCDGGILPVTARMNEHIAEMLADHLISNGVTILPKGE